MRGNTTHTVLVGPPPVPRTLGIWVALFTPTAIAWAIWPPPLLAALALIVALASLLLAQHTAVLVQQRHAPADAQWWLGLELLIAVLCGSFLVIQCHRSDLLVVAALGTAMWGVHHWQVASAGLSSSWMLALSGPAACVVSNRGIAVCAMLFFASAVVVSFVTRSRELRRAPGSGPRHPPVPR